MQDRRLRGVSSVVAVLLVVIVLLLAALGFASFQFGSNTQSTTTVRNTVTSTHVSIVSQPGPTTTVTVQKTMEGKTITEILVLRSATLGGYMYCSGNLTARECSGLGVVMVTTGSSTSYIFPANSTGVYFNATITQVTYYEVYSCGNATTSTSTMSYNSTSGFGSAYITWSRRCS